MNEAHSSTAVEIDLLLMVTCVEVWPWLAASVLKCLSRRAVRCYISKISSVHHPPWVMRMPELAALRRLGLLRCH